MESGRMLRNSQIIVLGICIAAATIVSSMILSGGFLKVMKFTRQQISVTGSAQKDIKSDLIVWYGGFTKRDPDLKTAHRLLKQDADKVKKYLIGKGIDEKELTIYQVRTDIIYKKNEKGYDTNDIQGYKVSQAFEVKSKDVDKVNDISRESTEIIDQGVEFESAAPEYFYTKLDELKIEMLARATENAKQRAENMAKATGNKIGFMRSARMGVFQITPVNSTEVSDYGVNDSASLVKKVTAVVNVSFAIE
ncbi:MAG: SIMPL domain-containing protein [Candidatus Saganbacteria bacterium]|nr:SIMPL domain-containing protein [Candidatus Saganbacteria bacterium]